MPKPTLEELLEKVRKLPPPTYWQKRSQAIDFSVGNLLVDKDPGQYDFWMLRKWAAEAYDRMHPAPRS